MNLHKVIVHPGIRTSERFGRANFFQRDLYYGLLSVAHGRQGWFENNAGLLRAALFAPCLGKVSERDVRDGLLKLREIGCVKLWTGKNGRAYGAIINYRQQFDYGEKLPEEAHPPPDDELPLDAAPADPPKQDRVEGRERGMREARKPRPPATIAGQEDQAAWVARLRTEWPAVDITLELLKAERDRRLKGRNLERLWFEEKWLPGCSQAVSFATAAAGTVEAIPEPEAWNVYLKDTYEGKGFGEDAARYDWPSMPRKWQERIVREMRVRRSA